MFKKYLKFVLVGILATTTVAVAVYAAPWTAPTFPPPPSDCPDSVLGCNPPVNISNIGQTKLGALIVGGFRSATNIFIGPSGPYSTVIQDSATQTYFAKRSATTSLIDINPEPALGFGGSVRFFRSTNTTGIKSVDFMRGNNTTYVDSRIGVDGYNSHFNISGGNVGFGTIFPVSKVDVIGDICWTLIGVRKCLSTFVPGGSFWRQILGTQTIENTNTGQVNITGKVNIAGKISVAGGIPGVNKLLVGEDTLGLARWRTLKQVIADDIAGGGDGGGDGIGNDVLFTTFSGCVPLLGCPLWSGDPGPTQNLVDVGNVGTLVMSCPAGYKVVAGGAECDASISFGYLSAITFLTDSRPISKSEWSVQCTKNLSNIMLALADLTIRSIEAMKKASITCSK